MTSSDKGSKETQIKMALVRIVRDKKVESIKTPKEEPTSENVSPISLPVQDSAPDQPSEIPSTPPSPSRYMRRLPPPAGFYLAKEHSYAQLCPLEWRKRYEKATDNLEKALRLLRAARRRENRLRLTLLRLQQSRLRQTLSHVQDRRKESHESQGSSSRGRQSGKLARSGQDRGVDRMEENEMESTGEEMELLTEESWRKEGAVKLKDGVEDEEGCCFYCGRGREDEETKEGKDQVGSHVSTALQRRRGRARTMSNVFREPTRNTDESKDESKPPVHQNVHPEQLLHSQPEMLLQMHTLSGPNQSTSTLQDVTSSPQLQHLHVLQPDLGLLHADTDINATQGEDGGGGMCHVYLVPMSSETKEKTRIGVEGAIQKQQSILVAEETFQRVNSEQGERLHVQSDAMGLRGNQNEQQTNIRATLVCGDVTQKLKEHLEGFQLQLSSEFID